MSISKFHERFKAYNDHAFYQRSIPATYRDTSVEPQTSDSCSVIVTPIMQDEITANEAQRDQQQQAIFLVQQSEIALPKINNGHFDIDREGIVENWSINADPVLQGRAVWRCECNQISRRRIGPKESVTIK